MSTDMSPTSRAQFYIPAESNLSHSHNSQSGVSQAVGVRCCALYHCRRELESRLASLTLRGPAKWPGIDTACPNFMIRARSGWATRRSS